MQHVGSVNREGEESQARASYFCLALIDAGPYRLRNRFAIGTPNVSHQLDPVCRSYAFHVIFSAVLVP